MASRPIPILTVKELYRFFSLVDERGPDDCWPWRGIITKSGYGQFKIFREGKTWTLKAHRVAYMIQTHDDPLQLEVCHKCNNRPCCNPAHLFKGTRQDNHADMVAKGRQARGDRSGPRLHPEKIRRGDEHGMHTHPESVARGERSANAKLTDARVRDIRQRFAAGGITTKTLANDYEVDQSLISLVVNRKIWMHI